MGFPVTHHFVKRKGQNRLVRVTPISRLSNGGEAVLFYKGRITNLEGVPIPEEAIPQWAKDSLEKLSSERKLELGFGREPEPDPEPAPVPSRSRGRRAVVEPDDGNED